MESVHGRHESPTHHEVMCNVLLVYVQEYSGDRRSAYVTADSAQVCSSLLKFAQVCSSLLKSAQVCSSLLKSAQVCRM